jgi:hypothetical protein
MKPPAPTLCRLVLGSVLLLAAPGAAWAEVQACTLLQPADLVPLLGKPVAGKPSGAACSWNAGGKKLVVSAMKLPGGAAPGAYAESRKQLAEDPDFKITDENGIGERAFTGRSSGLVGLTALKGSRLLKVMFTTGGSESDKEIAALRQVARKVVAAY